MAKGKKVFTQGRQGDVLVMRTDNAAPEGSEAVPRDKGRVVLAYGEVTGHAHALKDKEVELFTPAGTLTDEEVQERFLTITSPGGSLLSHEEHDALLLTQGSWRVIRQREYEPESWSFVAD